MPLFEDPLRFLASVEAMAGESGSLDSLTEDDASDQLFSLARRTGQAEPPDLPWLDIDKSIPIAVNERPGDDVAIALDDRTDPTDPRAVASDRARAMCMARGRTNVLGPRGRV